MNLPSLHRTSGNPYYLYAPDYRDTSSGVCVMHFLCHALNISGHEAYVVGCKVTNPNLRTPVLTEAIMQSHRNNGLAAIAVYPEVVSGNPLNSPVVVRYMLNRDGFISGQHVATQESDLFFYYAHDFAEGRPQLDLLTLPMIDSTLFAPLPTPVARQGNYLYLHRFDAQQVDYSLLPADVQVLSLAKPRTLAQLAELFQRAETLYSYEISATCTMAMLCGVPVVYLRGGHVHELPFTQHVGDAGATMYDEPGGLTRARQSVGLARQLILHMEDEFWPQLRHFIQRTQRSAADHQANSRVPSVREWLMNRMLTPTQQALVDERRMTLRDSARLTVVVNAASGDSQGLADTLESLALWAASSPLRLQAYIIAPQPPSQALPATFHWVEGRQDAALLNQIARQDDGDWLLLLDAGDEILPSASLMLDLELPGAQACRMLYCDEFYRGQGAASPILRPDMNLDYLLSLPAIMARHWLLRRDLVLDAGGFDEQFPQALELAMILRLIETDGIEGIGHLDEPLVVCDNPDMSANPCERAVIERHLHARGYAHGQVDEAPPRHYQLSYGHQAQPSVSILVPLCDQLELTQRCVESLLSKGSYPYFELLLIDHGSRDPALLAWLEQLVIAGEGTIKVIRDERPLNFSALYNLGARHAVGDFLVLMGNDTVIFQDNWLERMLDHAQRPEVGIVGAKLLDTSGNIAHAGYVLGLNGAAASPGVGIPGSEAGYLQHLRVDRNVSAVSSACLMIGRALYLNLGGLDEHAFALRLADVDLCLRANAQGLLTVWSAHAVVACEHGKGWASALRKAENLRRAREDEQNLHAQWQDALARDPAYNKNLSLRGMGYELPAQHALTWQPLNWRPLPVVLVHPDREQPERCTLALEQLSEHGMVDGKRSLALLSPIELTRLQPDVIVVQHIADPLRVETLGKHYQRCSAFKVLEVDTLPADTKAWSLLRSAIAAVDRVVVATAEQAQALQELHTDIRVRESRLPDTWQALPKRAPATGKLRIGCAVNAQTLALVEPLLRARANQAEWVLWGDVPAHLAALASQVYARDLAAQPDVLSSLGLDIALQVQPLDAPGHDPLATLRLAACGIAVISNDAQARLQDWPLLRADDTPEQWLARLDQCLQASEHVHQVAQRLREMSERQGGFDSAHRHACLGAWMPA